MEITVKHPLINPLHHVNELKNTENPSSEIDGRYEGKFNIVTIMTPIISINAMKDATGYKVFNI